MDLQYNIVVNTPYFNIRIMLSDIDKIYKNIVYYITNYTRLKKMYIKYTINNSILTDNCDLEPRISQHVHVTESVKKSNVFDDSKIFLWQSSLDTTDIMDISISLDEISHDLETILTEISAFCRTYIKLGLNWEPLMQMYRYTEHCSHILFSNIGGVSGVSGMSDIVTCNSCVRMLYVICNQEKTLFDSMYEILITSMTDLDNFYKDMRLQPPAALIEEHVFNS